MLSVHPKLMCTVASCLWMVCGVSYLLFPTWNARLAFGDRLLKSAEPYIGCLMQNASINLCKGVSLGHFLNVTLKAHSLITGWAGDTRRGAFTKGSVAWLEMLTHLAMASLFWLASQHPSLVGPTGGSWKGESSTAGGNIASREVTAKNE